MARSKSATLTEAELRIMNVLWDKGPATVHEVLQALPPKPNLAYNSVLTIIRILETKGYVKHGKTRPALKSGIWSADFSETPTSACC